MREPVIAWLKLEGPCTAFELSRKIGTDLRQIMQALEECLKFGDAVYDDKSGMWVAV